MVFSRRPDPRFNRGRIAVAAGSSAPVPSDVDFAAAGADFWLDASRPASYTSSGTTLTSLASLISGTPLNTIVGTPQIITDPRDDRPSFYFPRASLDYVTGVDATYIAAVSGTNVPFLSIIVLNPGDPGQSSAADSVRNTANLTGQEFISSSGLWYYERDGTSVRFAASEGVRAGTQLLMQYSEDGLTVKTGVNGFTESSATMLTAGAVTPNIVGVGIQTGSTNVNAFYGLIKERVYFGSAMTAPERAAWVAALIRKHPLVTAPHAYFVGDSITAANAGGVTSGGMPALLSQRMRSLGMYLDPQGPIMTGMPYPYRHSGVGGNSCVHMNTRVLNYIQGLGQIGGSAFNGGTPTASRGHYRRTRLACIFAGSNGVGPGSVAEYSTLLDSVYTQMLQAQPDFRIAVTPITDISGNSATVIAYNAGLIPVWDAFESAHPGVLIRWNAYLACPWNGTDFVDTIHPSDTGYLKLVDDPTYGLLQAVLPYLASIQGQAANM